MTPSTREKTETTTTRRTSTDRGHPSHLVAAGGTRCSACPESAILFATGESGGTGCRPGGRPLFFRYTLRTSESQGTCRLPGPEIRMIEPPEPDRKKFEGGSVGETAGYCARKTPLTT